MNVKMVRPSESELSCLARTNIMCPVKDCRKVLPQPPALRLHMVKVHKIVENSKDDRMLHRRKTDNETGVTLSYKCPVSECIYNGPRHFTTWKSVKQHYMKVHAEKKFCCETCSMKFGLPNDLKRHVTASHGRKGKEDIDKSHTVQQHSDITMEDVSGEDVGSTPSHPPQTSHTSNVGVKPPGHGLRTVPLLPKPNVLVMEVPGKERQVRLIYIADARPPAQTLPRLAPKPGLSGVVHVARQTDANTQTLVTCRGRQTGRPVPRGMRNHSSTQTHAMKRKRNVAQTQTTGDFILRRAMRSANIPTSKASTGCQMSPVSVATDWSGTEMDNGVTQTLVPKVVEQRGTNLGGANVVDASTAGCPANVVDASTESVIQPTATSVDAGCGTWDVGASGSAWDLPLPDMTSELTSNQLDMETQTMALLEELQASLAESISTQTLESFLKTAATTPMYLDERPLNSAHTQTAYGTLPPLESALNSAHTQTGYCTLSPLNSAHTQTGYCTLPAESPVNRAHTQTGYCTLAPESALNSAHTQTGYCTLPPESALNSAHTQTGYLSPESCLVPAIRAPDPLFGGCSTDNVVSTRAHDGANILADNFDFLGAEFQTDDLDPDYMHMETQTTMEDIFDQLLSNMETQTSDDVMFGDIEFNDSHTQTSQKPEPSSSFDSSSTETQTSLHTLVQSTNMAECNNTETQTLFTGIDFGTTLADSHTQT